MFRGGSHSSRRRARHACHRAAIDVVLASPVRSSVRLAAIDEHPRRPMKRVLIIVCGESFVGRHRGERQSGRRSRRGVGVPVHADVRAVGVLLEDTLAEWANGDWPVSRPPSRGVPRHRGHRDGVSKLVQIDLLAHLPAEDILEIMGTLAMVYLALAGLGAYASPADPPTGPPAATAIVVARRPGGLEDRVELAGVSPRSPSWPSRRLLVAKLRADTVVVAGQLMRRVGLRLRFPHHAQPPIKALRTERATRNSRTTHRLAPRRRRTLGASPVCRRSGRCRCRPHAASRFTASRPGGLGAAHSLRGDGLR
jgi:hypothetical protein